MMTESGRPYKSVRYDEIIEEQVAISYMSGGGVSITDTDNITQYDRKIILKSLIKIKEQESEQMKNKINGNNNVRKSTSRF